MPMSLLHLATLWCCLSVGWVFHQTPVCFGIITLHLDTPNSSMAGSGYLYATIARTSIFRHSSRVARRIHRRNGSWLIYTSILHGRTNLCSLQSSRINGKSHRWTRGWPPWSSTSLSSTRPGSRCATASRNFIIGEFAPSAVETNAPTSAHGWPIPITNLQTVSFPLCLWNAEIILI
jgi:hypothetical protein